MLLHLARLDRSRNPRRWRTLGLCVAALGLSAPFAMTRGAAPTPHPQPARAATRRPARAILVAGGQCARSGTFCASDLTCGAGERCVDVTGMSARVLRAAADDADAWISPTLTPTADGWALSFLGIEDERLDVWFARLQADGKRVGAARRLTNADTVKVMPDLAAGPAGFALAYTEIGDNDLATRVLRLDAQGAAQGQPITLGGDGFNFGGRVEWNGREYAAAWYGVSVAAQMSARFARYGQDGARVGGDTTLHSRFAASGLLGFAFTGDAYGVAFNTYIPRDERAETLFLRVGAGGEASAPLKVAQRAERCGSANLAWSGRNFGVIWEDEMSAEDDDTPLNRLAFAAVSPGRVDVPRREVTRRDRFQVQPVIAFGGGVYAVAWTTIGDDGLDVWLARLDGEGKPLGAVTQVTRNSMGLLPSVAWNGREFGIAWTDVRGGGVDVWFARYDAQGRRVGEEHRVSP
ncbi:MAG: hypothetical protein R3A48_03285 [Polyangiales bacterium]